MTKTTRFEVIPVEEVLRIANPIGEDEPADNLPDQLAESASPSQSEISDVPDEKSE